MERGVWGRAAFVALAVAAAGACAYGVSPATDSTVTDGGVGTGRVDAGDGDASDASGDFDAGGPLVDAAGGDGSGGDGASGDTSCTSPNACANARDIGQVSGDTSPSTNSVTATGSTSEWLTLKVTEDDSSPVGHGMGLKVTLAGPPGTNYDLYLYVDTGGSATSRACGTPTTSSRNPAGQTDQATLSWGEGSVANGSDDTRIVTIEVRNVSGPCGLDNPWTIVAQGNP